MSEQVDGDGSQDDRSDMTASFPRIDGLLSSAFQRYRQLGSPAANSTQATQLIEEYQEQYNQKVRRAADEKSRMKQKLDEVTRELEECKTKMRDMSLNGSTSTFPPRPILKPRSNRPPMMMPQAEQTTNPSEEQHRNKRQRTALADKSVNVPAIGQIGSSSKTLQLHDGGGGGAARIVTQPSHRNPVSVDPSQAPRRHDQEGGGAARITTQPSHRNPVSVDPSQAPRRHDQGVEAPRRRNQEAQPPRRHDQGVEAPRRRDQEAQAPRRHDQEAQAPRRHDQEALRRVASAGHAPIGPAVGHRTSSLPGPEGGAPIGPAVGIRREVPAGYRRNEDKPSQNEAVRRDIPRLMGQPSTSLQSTTQPRRTLVRPSEMNTAAEGVDNGAFAVVPRPSHHISTQMPTSTFAPDLRGLSRQPTLQGQTANVSQRVTLPPDDFFDNIRRRPQQQMGSSRMDAVEIGSSEASSSLGSIEDTQEHKFPEDVQNVVVYHLNPLTGGHEIAVESVATEVRTALAKIHDAHDTLVYTDRGSTYKCVFLGTKKQVVYWTTDHERERACKSCFNAHRVCFRFLEAGKYLALPLPDVLYEDDFQPDDLAFFKSDQSAKSRNMRSDEIWQKMPSKA